MRENPFQDDQDQTEDLVRKYEEMRAGSSHHFLDEEDFERIIDYYDDHERVPLAIEAAEAGMQQHPFASSLMIKKADLLLATRRYSEALNLLDAAGLLDSGDMNLYILRTEAFLALNQYDRALLTMDEAMNLFEGDDRVELLLELADVFDDYEEFEKVFDCMLLILQEDPNNEEALYKICFWTDYTGRFEESIRLHQRIIDEYPFNELAWFNLGVAFQGLKLYEKAIDAYQYCLAIDERFDYAHRNMADAYIRLRKYPEALEILLQLMEFSKPEDVLYEAMGFCYEKQQNFVEARNYYWKALKLSPEDTKIHYKIGLTYMQEEAWHQALQHLDEAMALHRNVPDYNLAKGQCLLAIGDIRGAITHLSLVVRLRPRSANGWEALIRCLFEAEFYEEALEQVLAAQEATAQKPVFDFLKVGILMAMGKTKEAVIGLTLAMERSPRLLRKLVSLQPGILQHQQIVEVVARFRKGSKGSGQ